MDIFVVRSYLPQPEESLLGNLSRSTGRCQVSLSDSAYKDIHNVEEKPLLLACHLVEEMLSVVSMAL